MPALLEALRCPYTGAGADASYVTSNKLLGKALLRGLGLPTPPAYTRAELQRGAPVRSGRYIVKSVWEHASVGLDEDSVVDIGDKVAMALAEAFSYAEDNAGFNGDGTSAYGGISGLVTKTLAQAASYHQAATGNVSDITLDLDDFNGVVAKLPNYANFRPVWFMHKTVWANSAQRLQMALGGVVPADVQAGAKPMLLGYPVEFTNVLDSTPTVDQIAAMASVSLPVATAVFRNLLSLGVIVFESRKDPRTSGVFPSPY